MSVSLTHSSPPSDQRNPWIVLVVLCSAVFMILLDTTLVNVAQREIQIGLGAGLTEIQWTLNSYILVFAVLLLSFGRLGDIFGRRRLFIVGISIFTTASALSGLSSIISDALGISGPGTLIAFRVLQGAGGAMVMPQSLSLLTSVFPPQQRGAAMGVWGSMSALGTVTGPVLGGFLSTYYGWEWVFFINIPVGVGVVLAAIRILPEVRDPGITGRGLAAVDWGGVALSGAAIFALVFSLIEGARLGWASPLILTLLGTFVVLSVVFVWWERRQAQPIIRFELFKIRNFFVGCLLALTVTFGMLGIFFPMTQYLQGGLGFTPLHAGLTMTPMSITVLFLAPLMGRLADRFGPRWILVTGYSLMATGIVVLIIQTTANATSWSLVPALVIMGIGMSMSFSPMTAAAMRDVPNAIAGSASGILNTMRYVGQVLGIAVLGSVLRVQLGNTTAERLEGSGVGPETQEQVIDYAASGRLEEIPGLFPEDATALLTFVQEQLQFAFADSVSVVFTVSAITCAVGAVGALAIRNAPPMETAAPQRQNEPSRATSSRPAATSGGGHG